MEDGAEGHLASEVCGAAADVLGGEPSGKQAPVTMAVELLAALGYRRPDGSDTGDRGAIANRRALLRLAARLRRLFPISPPDAPNLVFIGGEASPAVAGAGSPARGPVSLAGAGATFAQAFERCVGEGAEFLSQLANAGDIAERGRPAEVPHGLDPASMAAMQDLLPGADGKDRPPLDWVTGHRLSDSAPVLLPADLCLRRASIGEEPVASVDPGSGCAAGPTAEAAATAALLEAIERDAAALWWVGGRLPRPLSLESGAVAGAEAFLDRLRGGVTTRHSRLLDISTDLGVPCIAAVSLETDGQGFACGLAAGLTVGAAIRSAIVEMCQMELSHRIIELKRRQRGESALNGQDLAHLERGRSIDADHPSIQARGAPIDWSGLSERPGSAALSLGDIVDRVGGLAGEVYAVDCTRPGISIPVVKVVAPGLQPYPGRVTTPRLARIAGTDTRSEASVALL